MSTRVFNELGPYHSECTYKTALLCEFSRMNIRCQSEVVCPYMFDGKCVGFGKADIVTENTVLELKTVKEISSAMKAQVLSYTTSLKRNTNDVGRSAYIVNFNSFSNEVEVHRICNKHNVVHKEIISGSKKKNAGLSTTKMTESKKYRIINIVLKRFFNTALFKRRGVPLRDIKGKIKEHYGYDISDSVIRGVLGSNFKLHMNNNGVIVCIK
jgi:GxxExxY protein